MSLSLPASNSPLREMFEVSSLVSPMSLPTFRQALNSCQATVQQAGVATVQAIALRANGEAWLIQVGKKGGWKRLWNFGSPF